MKTGQSILTALWATMLMIPSVQAINPPLQVQLDVKFAQVTDADLDGFGIDVKVQQKANYLNQIPSLSGLGTWSHVIGVDLTSLGDTSMFGAEAGLVLSRPVPIGNTDVTVDIGLSAFANRITGKTVRYPTLVEDRDDMGYLIGTRWVDREETVGEVTLVGLKPTVGVSRKIPMLGDIPVLGRLFAGANVPVNESELIIFVGASLVGSTE